MSTSLAPLGTVAETIQDVATSVASTAVEQLEAIPDRVAALTGSRKPSRRTPWLGLVVAAVATAVVVAVLLRRRGGPDVDRGVDQGVSENGANPVRSHTDRAVTAAST